MVLMTLRADMAVESGTLRQGIARRCWKSCTSRPFAATSRHLCVSAHRMKIELNGHHLTWYMHEISMHCLGANLAYRELRLILEDVQTRQSRLVWFQLTSFLHHAAMVSKFLAPIKSNAVASVRGTALRKFLDIEPSSEVLSRDARDNIEHFDERIDRWVSDSTPSILESVLDNRSACDYLRVSEKRVKRVLIANEMVFVSENRDGSKFEVRLQSVFEELQRICTAVERWIDQSSPYTFIFPKHER